MNSYLVLFAVVHVGRCHRFLSFPFDYFGISPDGSLSKFLTNKLYYLNWISKLSVYILLVTRAGGRRGDERSEEIGVCVCECLATYCEVKSSI